MSGATANVERLESPSRRTVDASSEDRQWVRCTLDGNQDAFENLVRRYQGRLYDLAVRLLQDSGEAEDAVQDAFLQAYQHLADFKGQSTFSTWLYSITLNRLRNRLRHNRILRWMSLDLLRENRDGRRGRELPHSGPSFEDQTERRLQLEAIERIVRTFPMHYQSIFFLYYFENLTLGEVGERLSMPATTAKVYLFRARRLLYQKLREQREVSQELMKNDVQDS